MNQTLVNKISGILHENESLTWDVTEDLARKILTALGADDDRHIIRVQQCAFTMQHPVHERLLGSLMECGAHALVVEQFDFNLDDGYYYVEVVLPDSITITKKED